ncbi:MAG: hypothetical protein KKG53_08415 [Proteobacteria bacterium]|nr:hypothetical protein [Pseudomonadota bacterium]
MRHLPFVFMAFVSATALFVMTPSAQADSILDIPKGTTFELLQELEIPANRNFALLGRNEIDEAFNSTGQVLNDMDGRPLGYTGTIPRPIDFLTFHDYYGSLFESYEQTYVQCLERHRTFTMVPGSPASAPVIIQQGQGNVTVFNQAGGTPDEVYSTIGDNYCTQPNHTIAALVIDRDRADGGGFFAEGYTFKVRKVRVQRGRLYNLVTISFDHDILNGIVIVTTHNPEAIPMGALSGESSSGGGFWASVGNALADMNSIGGDYFSITLPEKRYYD